MMNRILDTISSVVPSQGQQSNDASLFYSANRKGQIIKEGWLRKPTPMRGWHKRWFVLLEDELIYYSGEGPHSKVQGSVKLKPLKWINPVSSTDNERFIFEIVSIEKNGTSKTSDMVLLATDDEKERLEWMQELKQAMYTEIGGAIFGQDLNITMLYENMKSPRKLPYIVECCVGFLTENGIDSEGIFRLSGRSSFIKELKDLFDRAELPDFEQRETDINTVASLLKLYLRELPGSLIPDVLYDKVMHIVLIDRPRDPAEAQTLLKDLLHSMPRHSYNLLQYLCKFLNEVARHEKLNKMSISNLATVFHSIILEPATDDPALLMATTLKRTEAVMMLIEESDVLLAQDYARGEAVLQEKKNVSSLLRHSKSVSNYSRSALTILQDNEDMDLLPTPLLPYNNNNISKNLSQISNPGNVSFQVGCDSEATASESQPIPIPAPRTKRSLGSPQNRNSNESVKSIIAGLKQQVFTNSPNVALRPTKVHESDRCIRSKALLRNMRTRSKSVPNECQSEILSDEEMDEPLLSMTLNDKSKIYLDKEDLEMYSRYSRNTRSDEGSRRRRHIDRTKIGASEDNDAPLGDDELIKEETKAKTLDELKEHTEKLRERLKAQKEAVVQLRGTLQNARELHRQEVDHLQERLDLERRATIEAIGRMESCQHLLAEYRIKYGDLLELSDD